MLRYLLYSFLPLFIQVQSEAVKAAEAVKRRAAGLLFRTHTRAAHIKATMHERSNKMNPEKSCKNLSRGENFERKCIASKEVTKVCDMS